ncbi:M1 family aminopeptidase [Chitinophaga barathri]|uniref:Peptidase M1 membrane alanine aminopeptidase domain-containing protein n=1 Tax=Chitinophaga barathri TaxID=1647451 RepID=A0A3N4M6U7_9BACT|nr:M1 family aminopeptidase [Chitinophaga barathri]RPD39144.1 hypothetical protein EG028_21265 [Chitinophaga barathri]
MLTQLLRFEYRYHLKQLSFLAAAVIFFALGLTAVFGNYRGSGVHVNGPYVVTLLVGILSLSAIFASIVFCANVVLRDTHHRTEQFIYTSSLTKPVYFISRLAGLLLAVFVLLCLASVGLMAGSLLVGPGKQGPFNIFYFVQPLLLFGLPNILFGCGLVFATALLTRSAKAVYVTGVLLYVLYMLGSVLGNSPMMANSNPGDAMLPALLDPFGLAAFFGETRGWTNAQMNVQLFSPRGVFLLNRVLWLGVSVIMLFIAYRAFSFRPQVLKTNRSVSKTGTAMPIAYRRIQPVFKGYALRAGWMQFKLEAAAMFKNIPLIVMLLLWVVLMGIELNDNLFHGLFDTSFHPSTGIIVEELHVLRPAMLLIIFCAAELVRRERTVNIHSLVYTTPVRNILFPAVQCAVLALVIFALVSLNILLGLGLQWSHGYFKAELPVYFSLYYYSGLPLLLFGALAVFIQTLIPHKYTGMLACLLMAGLIMFSRKLGVENFLFRYAVTPDMKYSDMNGFGHFAKAFNWYMLYWGAFAMLLLFLSAVLWKRTRRTGERVMMFTIPCLLLVLAASAFIYSKQHNYNFEKWEVVYEKRFRQYADMPQPDITAVRTETDIYPGEARYTVKGWYHLENRSGKTIAKILAGAHPEMTSLHFSGNAASAGHNQFWITLPRPLAPGDTMSLAFTAEADRNSFLPFNNEHSIVANGSYVELEKYLPYIGFNAGLTLGDTSKRREMGLPPIMQGPTTVSPLVDFETVISTVEGQQVITSGTLLKDWSGGGRHYFHYKTAEPILQMFAFSSARYALRRDTLHGIDLRFYFREDEKENVPALMQGLRDGLAYCNAQFSPYTQRSLTMAEIPQYRGVATAYPGVVFAAERLNFKGDFRDSNKVNFAYATTAHEVSHQWWAMKLIPADTSGSKFLTESLAKYTEAMVLEKARGKMHLRNYLLSDNNWYMYVRSFGVEELPLVNTDGETHVVYQKGGLAMYRLKETLGEERVNAALRRALAAKVSRSEELIKELTLDATPDEINLINTCLREVITYSLGISIISCEPVNGKYKLTLKIKTLRNGGTANDLLPIAVFAQADPLAGPIYEKMHRFTGKETLITLLLDQKPAAAAIDPYAYIPDDNRRDNVAVLP